MDKIKDLVTKKIGPLPAWVWVSGGIAAFYIWRMVKANKPEPEEQQNPGSQGMAFYGTGTGNVGLPLTPPPPMEPAYGPSSYISLPGGYTFEGDYASLSQLLPLLGGFGQPSTVQNPASTSPMAPYVEPYVAPYVAPYVPPVYAGCYAGVNNLSGRTTYYASLSDCQAWASGCYQTACL